MRKGIKNFIFDMGNVIIRFDPEVFMDRENIDSDDRKIIREMIYDSKMWYEMDLGELDEDRMIEIVKPLLPLHLRSHTERLIKGWCDPIIMIEGIEELIIELKNKGYDLYLLSNASFMQKKYWPNIECSKYFDGTVVSAFERVTKPDEKIYKLLLDRFNLKAEECIFIDDSVKNIEAAEKLGFDTFYFEGDAFKLREYIDLCV